MPLMVDYELTGSGRKIFILKDLSDQYEDKIFPEAGGQGDEGEEYLCTTPVWEKRFTTPEGLSRAVTNYLKGGRAVANKR
jgi:hypothetical protein